MDRRFFRAAALCAFAVGLIVLAQAFLVWRFPDPPNLEAEIVQRHALPFVLGQWLPFIGIFPALLVLGATALRKRPTYRGLVFTGFLAALIWAVLELLTRGEGIFVVNGVWAARAAELAEGAARTRLLEQMQFTRDLHLAHFVLVSYCAIVIGLCFGGATWSGRGVERAVSLAFFAYAGLMIAYRLGWSGTAADAAYFVIRSTDRFLLGTWLWRTAAEERQPSS